MVVIMSLDRDERTELVNNCHRMQFEKILEDFTHTVYKGVGVFEGSEEVAYMFHDVDKTLLAHLKGQAKFYDQECIFVCEDDGSNPRLVCGKSSTQLGKKLTTSSVKPSSDYTQIGDTFYIVI